jgi:methionine sulfoxide reductase heme-binding subunit
VTRLPVSRYFVWLVLAAPGCYWLAGYWRETFFYGEVVHASGALAARLLILTLALSPLARLLPRMRWLSWLRRQRRYVGVASFAYAAMHAAVYFQRQADLARILHDAREAAMWTGWIGLVPMLVLAATSNDASVRWLRRRWQLVHRAVYAAALLAFAHWVLSAFDPREAYLHFAVLAVFLLLRFVPKPVKGAAQSGKA